MGRADWTGKVGCLQCRSAARTKHNLINAAVLRYRRNKTLVINWEKLSFQVHLGSGNRVLPSAFSYRSSQAAFFCFCAGLGKYR